MKVVNCRSEEHAKMCLAELDKQGYRWADGDKLTDKTEWHYCEEDTCYELDGDDVFLDDVSYYLERGYEIEVYKGESK